MHQLGVYPAARLSVPSFYIINALGLSDNVVTIRLGPSDRWPALSCCRRTARSSASRLISSKQRRPLGVIKLQLSSEVDNAFDSERADAKKSTKFEVGKRFWKELRKYFYFRRYPNSEVTRYTFYGTRYLSHCSTCFAFNPLYVNWVTSLTPRCHVMSLVT